MGAGDRWSRQKRRDNADPAPTRQWGKISRKPPRANKAVEDYRTPRRQRAPGAVTRLPSGHGLRQPSGAFAFAARPRRHLCSSSDGFLPPAPLHEQGHNGNREQHVCGRLGHHHALQGHIPCGAFGHINPAGRQRARVPHKTGTLSDLIVIQNSSLDHRVPTKEQSIGTGIESDWKRDFQWMRRDVR